jgi:hypothetical protein
MIAQHWQTFTKIQNNSTPLWRAERKIANVAKIFLPAE